MASLYHKKEWQNYRKSCLELRENKCERCGSSTILQVHHPEYIDGLKPWEYPVEFCEVLCRRCHAEEHGKIPPSDGWIILHSDLEENVPSDPTECGYCGADIRWHVTVFHHNWGEMIVGSECAENLSLGPELKELKSFNRRLNTFISSPRWKKTKNGFKIVYRSNNILIYEKEGFFRLKIDDIWGRNNYNTINEAKMRAFSYIAKNA